MRDPRVGFVTVTNVLVTGDLSHARVMVSVPGDDTEQARALEGLQSAARFLRSQAARALSTRIVPELHFELDKGWRTRPGSTSCSRASGARSQLIGALLVDKPAGPTSHDVVQRVRRVLKTRAVGHTGTLDPFATGLLVVLVGRATRLARFVEAEAKTYLATARLGIATDTDDAHRRAARVTRCDRAGSAEARVAEALAGFAGEQRQRPPLYSAKHVDGERSHRLARRGVAVQPAETTVVVRRIELVE